MRHETQLPTLGEAVASGNIAEVRRILDTSPSSGSFTTQTLAECPDGKKRLLEPLPLALMNGDAEIALLLLSYGIAHPDLVPPIYCEKISSLVKDIIGSGAFPLSRGDVLEFQYGHGGKADLDRLNTEVYDIVTRIDLAFDLPTRATGNRICAVILDVLLDAGADPNYCHPLHWDGRTLLFHCVSEEHIRILLSHGADKSVKDHWGRQPFKFQNKGSDAWKLLKDN